MGVGSYYDYYDEHGRAMKTDWRRGDGAECFRCGHKWTLRKDGQPEQCPHCKNPKWRFPRPSIKPRLPEVTSLVSGEVEYVPLSDVTGVD
jgi:hypothetical protein